MKRILPLILGALLGISCGLILVSICYRGYNFTKIKLPYGIIHVQRDSSTCKAIYIDTFYVDEGVVIIPEGYKAYNKTIVLPHRLKTYNIINIPSLWKIHKEPELFHGGMKN